MTCWIDEPRGGFRYLMRDGFTVCVAGWASVDARAADRVRIEVDGETVDEQTPATPRPDVARAHPVLAADADRLGFTVEVALPQIAAGAHTLSVVAERAGCVPQRAAAIGFTAVPEDALATLAERFAFLPAELVNKVNGAQSLELFENIGRLTVRTICEYVTPGRHDAVLDFGSGLGRVLIPFKQQFPETRFTAFDIDPDMLGWARFLCAERAERYTLSTDGFADASYDLVYAISVFTHLDDTTDHWLGEIRRLLKPGGRAFITYHDETLFAEHAGTSFVPGSARGDTLERYFVVGRGTSEGGAAMGTYYHTRYWKERIARYFTAETTVPRGLLDYQSISIVQA